MSKPLIDPEKLYQVTDIPGYTPNISRLICMMDYARVGTLHSVKGLTIKELDHLFDDKSNSIGALLLHLASTEFFFQKMSFEERKLSEEEWKEWQAPTELGELGRKEIKGNDLDYYINILDDMRQHTYEVLKEKDDAWLEKKIPYENSEANNYHLWFHVFEDEINHRGQISWLRKRLKSA